LKASQSLFIVSFLLAIVILLSNSYVTSTGEKSDFPLTAMENIIGVKGTEFPDGVYIFSLPRDDIPVRVGEITLNPAMVIDSWVAFADTGDRWMMMGDLALRPAELQAAQYAVRREGLDITAIHNTLVGETPQVYDLHIGGSGDPEAMAESLHAVLKTANFTVSHSSSQTGTMPQYLPDTDMIDRIMGTNGSYEDGVLQYRMPRAESIVENGMKIPPSLDVATVIKLQPLPDGQAAMTGEFVLVGTEVQPVFRKLNDNGIMVTAIHSHMLEEQPRLIYMHVWAVGDRQELARGLREAIDQTNVVK
jgi:hypothetical protein